jgi:hypothetical protein
VLNIATLPAAGDVSQEENMAMGTPVESTRKKNADATAMGISTGIAIGVALGAAFDDMAVGLGVGIALGASIGMMYDRRRKGSASRE